jgi:CDP-diacylglycerol pyrophosphatase
LKFGAKFRIGPSVFVAIGLLAAAGALVLTATAAADPNTLWKVVHGLCVRDQQISHIPAPCVAVDLKSGYAVLKDERGRTQVLVIPIAKVTGIESPELLAPDGPNYWQQAWAARRYVERFAGQAIPRDDLALAVNSAYGRTQDQLHIHVDCIKTSVKQALAPVLAAPPKQWTKLDMDLPGGPYSALWVESADLTGINPFGLLAADPAASADMSRETLAAIPTATPTGAQGFLLLAGHADSMGGGHAESVIDHSCKVLSAG